MKDSCYTDFYDEVLDRVVESIQKFSDRNAFCIDEEFYTYEEFGKCVSKIRAGLINTKHSNDKVGLVINDDLETYASIIALWLEGESYVPLHPNWPLERCLEICRQVELDLIIDSSEECRYDVVTVLETRELQYEMNILGPKENVSPKELAYMLFTSGSTGKPKGVPIMRGNLSSFVRAFFDMGFTIDENDKFLQCFDLSFDLSVMSYVIPLLEGSCVYTVSPNGIKYLKIYEILEEYEVTCALMAPSTITYLQPYFDEIELPSLRYCLFCGEALRTEVTREWSKRVPNAKLYNVYGPTENTIFCTYYEVNFENDVKDYNGVLSIGKTMTSGKIAIFDENRNVVNRGELGELCLSGKQLFHEYWKNKEKTEMVFFQDKNGIRWYKSGDLCFEDENGDIMYSGRMDHQAKIQGFRVEMGEIEYHAREFLNDTNVVCMAFENKENLTEIAMFVEKENVNVDELKTYMKSKMPAYMIPTKMFFMTKFPLNANDKVDKVELKKLLVND